MPEWNSIPVLIVEDQVEVAAVLRRALQGLGYGEVEIASDGRRALDQLRLGNFSLVLADLVMEPMSGIELIEAIRKDERCRDVPIVAVSGRGDAKMVAAAKRAGATSFILKPYNMATLQSKVKAALGQDRQAVSQDKSDTVPARHRA